MPQVGNKKFAYNAAGIREAMKALKNKKRPPRSPMPPRDWPKRPGWGRPGRKPKPIQGRPFPKPPGTPRPGNPPGGGRDFRPLPRPTRPMTPGNRVPKPPNRRYL
jgi:hypothetical protein